MNNPAFRILVQETLSSPTDDNKTRARKLFLLEKLSEPTIAPPVVPKNDNNNKAIITKLNKEEELERLANKVDWAQQKKNVENVRQSMRVRGGSTVKKKVDENRRATARYDPNQTALQLRIGDSNKFYPVLTLAHDTRLKNWGWNSRIILMKDIIQQLKTVHENGLIHNSLISDVDAMLVDSTTMRGTLSDPSGTVMKNDSIFLQKLDILGFGKTFLALICRGEFASPPPCFPTKHELHIESSHYDESMVSELDSAVRNSLEKCKTPGSLLELCAQCCSLNLDLRPSAEDLWHWLDSILEDFEKSGSGTDELSISQIVEEVQKLDLAFVTSPRLIDLTKSYDDDATSVSTFNDDASVISNDSIIPPPLPPRPAENRKSKLLEFLQDKPAAKTNEIRRPQSLNFDPDIPTSDSDREKTVEENAALEVKESDLVRRRSLDRGYMWAKARLEENKTLPKRKVKTDVKAVKEAWKITRAALKPRTSKEIATLFRNQERIPPEEAIAILQRAELILKKEPNLLELKPPVIVIGDIHGQFFDLLNLLDISGFSHDKKLTDSFLFLGDYVDRGDFSCEVLLYLMSLKCDYPQNFHFLRGNHEARSVSAYFGFKKEAEAKYGLAMFNRACQTFQTMPIAALLQTDGGRWLCCHGGISPNVTTLSQFREFDRFVEPGMNGFLCDILWSDPVKEEDGLRGDIIDFLPNPVRGCSYRYGLKSLNSFLAINRLVGIIRAHEVIQNGYRFHFQRANNTPPVITVFSAPNYCGRYGNRGAILRVNTKPVIKRRGLTKPLELIEPIIFSEVSHPTPFVIASSKQVEVEGRIAEMCPYMPTTFQGFLERAVELAHLQIELFNRDGHSTEKLPSLNENSAVTVLEDKKEYRPLSFRMNSAIQTRMRGMSNIIKKARDPSQKFLQAAQNDSVNELNPSVITSKMEEAKQKNIAFMSGVDDTDAITVVVLPEQSSERKGFEKKPSVHTVSRRSLRVNSIVTEDILSIKEEDEHESTISFTSEEILALQLLFLLIDQKDKSFLVVDDLMSWSVEAGNNVQRADAESLLNILDLDGDGKIGFSDYLGFAARAKDQWLLQKYVEVKVGDN